MITRILLIAALGAGAACTPDYQLENAFLEKAYGSDDWGSLSFHVNFQRGGWGEDLFQCSFELALYEPFEDDGYGDGQIGQVIELPETDGECVATWFDLDEDRTPGAMTIRGSRSAGEAIYLRSADHQIVLERQLTEDDQPVYRMPDCSEETFPFGQSFDLDVPGEDASGGVPGFYAADAIVVGPSIDLIEPTEDALDGDFLMHPQAQALEASWAFGQDLPAVGGVPMARELLVFMNNYLTEDFTHFESLTCAPEGPEALAVAPEDLAQLTANPADGESWDNPYQTSFQVNTRYTGPEFETPWGSLSRVSSNISVSGIVVLQAPE